MQESSSLKAYCKEPQYTISLDPVVVIAQEKRKGGAEIHKKPQS